MPDRLAPPTPGGPPGSSKSKRRRIIVAGAGRLLLLIILFQKRKAGGKGEPLGVPGPHEVVAPAPARGGEAGLAPSVPEPPQIIPVPQPGPIGPQGEPDVTPQAEAAAATGVRDGGL